MKTSPLTMKHFPFLLLLILVFSGCQEDPIELRLYGRIEGELLEDDGTTPIPNAVVTTNPATNVVFTNEFGIFLLDSLEAGLYSVRAKKEGYEDGVTSTTVLEDRTVHIKVLASFSQDNNQPPALPALPNPANGTLELEPTITLSWQGIDTDADTLSYDVYLFEPDAVNITPMVTGIRDTFYHLPPLEFGKTYFWQIVAKDGHHAPVYGEVWSFSTRPFPIDDYRYTFVRKSNGMTTIFGGEADSLTYELATGYWRPRINPLRDRLAALSIVGTEVHLFTMNREGKNIKQVTSDVALRSKDELNAAYCWSPNGSQLLYMNYQNLYTINADGTGLDLVARADSNFFFTGVDWTAFGGDRIVATMESPNSNYSQLYLFQLGLEPTQLLDTVLNGLIRHPTFSPSGKQVAFSYNAADQFSALGDPLNTRILVYDTETEELFDYSFQKQPGTNDLQPRFINGGAEILFVNSAADDIAPRKIMVMELLLIDIQDRRPIFENADMPDWR